jgi:3-methyl-2-oxobutanoate hydroxymethyltransferase
MKTTDFIKYKKQGKKITLITCYDYTFARIVAETDIHCILIGDSASMTMHGHADTTSADVDMIALHTKAVSRSNSEQLIIADLPFMSYRGSLDRLIDSVTKLIQSGAHAVKLEGVDGNIDYIKHLVASGVPVMGHIGLTPQFVNVFGGYKVQGKTEDQAKVLLEQARALQEAGCFSIVLECVPSTVAKEISTSLSIPTIGIGAGVNTDGQILVLQDLLGMNTDFKPKFVKQFMDGHQLIKSAIQEYCDDVNGERFPSQAHSFASTPTKSTGNVEPNIIKKNA